MYFSSLIIPFSGQSRHITWLHAAETPEWTRGRTSSAVIPGRVGLNTQPKKHIPALLSLGQQSKEAEKVCSVIIDYILVNVWASLCNDT